MVKDQALLRELQEAIMAEIKWKLLNDPGNYERWEEISTYLMLMWLAALQGNEVMTAIILMLESLYTTIQTIKDRVIPTPLWSIDL